MKQRSLLIFISLLYIPTQTHAGENQIPHAKAWHEIFNQNADDIEEKGIEFFMAHTGHLELALLKKHEHSIKRTIIPPVHIINTDVEELIKKTNQDKSSRLHNYSKKEIAAYCYGLKSRLTKKYIAMYQDPTTHSLKKYQLDITYAQKYAHESDLHKKGELACDYAFAMIDLGSTPPTKKYCIQTMKMAF